MCLGGACGTFGVMSQTRDVPPKSSPSATVHGDDWAELTPLGTKPGCLGLGSGSHKYDLQLG